MRLILTVVLTIVGTIGAFLAVFGNPDDLTIKGLNIWFNGYCNDVINCTAFVSWIPLSLILGLIGALLLIHFLYNPANISDEDIKNMDMDHFLISLYC